MTINRVCAGSSNLAFLFNWFNVSPNKHILEPLQLGLALWCQILYVLLISVIVII